MIDSVIEVNILWLFQFLVTSVTNPCIAALTDAAEDKLVGSI